MTVLDITRERMNQVDRREIYKVYEAWPRIAQEAWESVSGSLSGRFDRVAFLALGGSASAGDIISDWMLSVGGLEFTVFKGDLPKIRLENTLVIACSASGNTYETLRMAQQARKTTNRIVVISSGGRLQSFADKSRLAHVKIPLMIAPRYTLSYVLFASLAVMRDASIIDGFRGDIDEAIRSMRSTSKKISSEVPSSRNRSKQLARLLAHSRPKIYGSSLTKGVATRLKSSLNENAKMHASVAYSPELFHNEVESWELEHRDHFLPVFLRHAGESPFERRRIGRLLRILRDLGVKGEQITGVGRSSISQLVSMVYVADFAAYYTAIVRGVDPFEIRIIDKLKSVQAR